MAPVELNNLSSNWKRLQASLKSSKPAESSKHQKFNEKEHSLKRKRRQVNGVHTPTSSKAVNANKINTPQKALSVRKRQKMDEPASVGASVKHPDTKNLSRSVSMPSLQKNSLAISQHDDTEPLSLLAAHSDFPDIKNEGVSELALPGKYVALDCEMVGIGPEPDRDSALARVSLVNFHGHQVYDSYVQMLPKIEVTDYRTFVSGIEPRHLHKDVARPFDEVRADLTTLLGGRILVGHAVKHDLKVLILKHDPKFIRDTSKFTKFRALAMRPGGTPGLKLLAEKLLGVEIQTGAHSSVEDARATMALYRLHKTEFEAEIRQKYGHQRLEPFRPDIKADDDEQQVKKVRNRKKTKKKRKN
ncbi:RNA exonuclease-like protein [Phaeosphaeriaceae sp. PMI808]|nr:RNA exonuclease-like protein [Phaeosphaeriaceae sp. PMI808]